MRVPMSRFFLTLPLLFLVACADVPERSTAPAPQEVEALTESERLYEWLDEVFYTELEYSPMSKTQLGMIDSDLDAYGRWDDFSDAAAEAANEREQSYLQELRQAFDTGELDEDARMSYRFAEYQWEISDRQYQVRESAYAYSPMQDAVSSLTTFLINNHRIDSEEHARAWLSRVQDLDTVIDTLVDRAERRAEAGVLLPEFAWPRLLASARDQLSGQPFDASGEESALLADFRNKIESMELAAAQQDELIDEAADALQSVYQPALLRYIESLETLQQGADELDGAWKLPDGDAFYAVQVARYTTRDDLTPEEIHAIGLAEVERIQDEMREIMADVDFAGDLGEFFEFLRNDPRFYYPDTDEGREAYLQESTEMIEQVMAVAPMYFNRLPEAELEVRAVEAFREATATGAFYNQPALDGSRPGYYYVNLSDMSDNPNYLMESLAYHEGAPGHHFQLALAQELDSLPMMQRLTFHSAYVEGWALYAEALGKDMGFFTDPYMDFGRLSYELFRAVRLVVDTGIHDQRWTRQEAIDYMMANTPMTEGDITPEVERYIVWPAQALSYKIGMNTILELREEAMAALGDDFSWGDFHDAVLTAGSLPLPVLSERVRTWIAN